MPVTAQTSEPLLWPLLAGLFLVLINGFFVAVEFAIVTVRRGQMQTLAGEGVSAGRIMANLLRDPDRAIAGTQVGVTTASILLGVVAEEPLQQLLAPGLNRLLAPVPVLGDLAGLVSTILILMALSFITMVLGEQAPKTIALRSPVKTALVVARPIAIFTQLTAPLVWVVDQSTSLVLRLIGVRGETSHGIHTTEELKEVVRETQQEGVLPFSDPAMLVRALDFGGRFVREAMIPRPDIVAVEKSATLGDLLQTFKRSRHARFPVYEEDLDHISGVVAVKDVLSALADDCNATARPLAELGLIRPAMVVPESRHIGDLFNEMRREQRQMAIVIDEFGGTAGLVTAEELVEEVVGRLTDEWVKEPPPVATVGRGVFEIDAQNRVDEVNDALHLDLPTSDDYETVAGFLLFLLRRIPKTGETVDYGRLRFTIVEMTGVKIERVRIERVDMTA